MTNHGMSGRALRKATGIILGGIAALALLAGGGTAAVAAASTAPTGVSTAKGISLAKAVQIAKKRVPGARVTEVEREREHGHRTWKVELRKGKREYEVYVSIATGKIIKFKVD